MLCPFCKKEKDRVVDSRPLDNAVVIRRRRECRECHRRFTTYERLEEMPLMVVKQGGNREPYDRDKLRQGILRAGEKRPIPIETIEKIVADIDLKVQEYFEIPSHKIGEMVLEQLLDVDPVAYVRFASVYRRFDSIEVFLKELRQLKDNQFRRKKRSLVHHEAISSAGK